MTDLRWIRDFEAALRKARDTGRPVYHDFWFEG